MKEKRLSKQQIQKRLDNCTNLRTAIALQYALDNNIPVTELTPEVKEHSKSSEILIIK